jgi:small subunit ribosomal protein S21
MPVFVGDNDVNSALPVLKKKMQREGTFREMKRRRAYEKPSERRAREKPRQFADTARRCESGLSGKGIN